jgi:hypothetical protein
MSKEIKQLLGDFLVENTKPESYTPRCDSYSETINGYELPLIPLEFARTLERELKSTQAALDQMTADCVKLASQLDRSISISDGIMAWETPAQARQSSKDLSQLKKEIKEN